MRLIDVDRIVQEIQVWRDQLVKAYGENDEYVLCLDEVLMKLDDTPTADAAERKKGKWTIDRDCEGKSRYVTCNICRHREFNWYNPNFCPNCGADMRGTDEAN